MLLSGIDEAGRGPVVGPIVMGIATFNHEDISFLKDIGVKDSKLLSPKKRELLYDEIKSIAKEYRVLSLDAYEIDILMARMSLNEIERRISADLINGLKYKPDKIYVDCPDTNPSSYKLKLESLVNFSTNFVVEHKADLNYLPVSASSILAKVERDRYILNLEKELGQEIGSGYPSDPKTKKFLEFALKNDVPKYIRGSWKTTLSFLSNKKTSKLF